MVSTTGPQALTFLNGAFIYEQSRHFAARLISEVGEDAREQVTRMAFVASRGRGSTSLQPFQEPSATAFLDKQHHQIDSDASISKADAGPGESRSKALEAFCLVILNLNEFVYNN